MKLGILVSTDRHMEELSAIVRAAIGKGHEVSVFVMGEGARFLVDEALGGLGSLEGVNVAYCDFNATKRAVDRSKVQSHVRSGSQLDNALMVRDSDRVIVL